MTELLIISVFATTILLIVKLAQWLIGIATISLFWVCSPLMIAVGMIVFMLVLILAIEITRAALWKRK